MTKVAGWVRLGVAILLLAVWTPPTGLTLMMWLFPEGGELVWTVIPAVLLLWLAIELLMVRPAGRPSATVRRLARHLAAQAVASDVTGFGEDVHISLDARLLESRGVVVYTSAGPSTSAPEQWWSELVARLAGDLVDLAEASASHGDLTNILQAETVASWIAAGPMRPEGYPDGPLDPDSILSAAREYARTILTGHADWVDAVAEELLTTGHLTGAEVSRLAPTGAAA